MERTRRAYIGDVFIDRQVQLLDHEPRSVERVVRDHERLLTLVTTPTSSTPIPGGDWFSGGWEKVRKALAEEWTPVLRNLTPTSAPVAAATSPFLSLATLVIRGSSDQEARKSMEKDWAWTTADFTRWEAALAEARSAAVPAPTSAWVRGVEWVCRPLARPPPLSPPAWSHIS